MKTEYSTGHGSRLIGRQSVQKKSQTTVSVSRAGWCERGELGVTINVSYLSFSWMGGEGVTQQATITVPDNNNFDVETGVSSLSLPTWVMYSFPTAQNDYGETQGTTAGQTMGWIW